MPVVLYICIVVKIEKKNNDPSSVLFYAYCHGQTVGALW